MIKLLFIKIGWNIFLNMQWCFYYEHFCCSKLFVLFLFVPSLGIWASCLGKMIWRSKYGILAARLSAFCSCSLFPAIILLLIERWTNSLIEKFLEPKVSIHEMWQLPMEEKLSSCYTSRTKQVMIQTCLYIKKYLLVHLTPDLERKKDGDGVLMLITLITAPCTIFTLYSIYSLMISKDYWSATQFLLIWY